MCGSRPTTRSGWTSLTSAPGAAAWRCPWVWRSGSSLCPRVWPGTPRLTMTGSPSSGGSSRLASWHPGPVSRIWFRPKSGSSDRPRPGPGPDRRPVPGFVERSVVPANARALADDDLAASRPPSAGCWITICTSPGSPGQIPAWTVIHGGPLPGRPPAFARELSTVRQAADWMAAERRTCRPPRSTPQHAGSLSTPFRSPRRWEISSGAAVTGTRQPRPCGSGRPGLEHIEVPFGVQPVLPLLVENGLQAPAYGEALRFWVARLHDGFGHAGQLLVGEIGDHLAHGGHAVRAQGEHLVQRRPRAAVVRDAGFVGHLVVGQVQPVPGRRLPQDCALHPSVGGEDEMAQRLDEGPLSIDSLVEQLRCHAASPPDGPLPQPLENVPCFAEPFGIGRPHLHAVRVTTVELRLYQGHDVDAVDSQVPDLAAQVHVHQGCATDHDPRQIDQVEARVGEVDVVEPCAGQVNVLEPRAGQVLTGEVSHPTSLPRNALI